MNLESNPSKKSAPVVLNDDIDFDFKPITSGLGFHGNKPSTEFKPVFNNEISSINSNQVSRPMQMPKQNDNQIYQNEFSAFYAHENIEVEISKKIDVNKPEKVFRIASKSNRVLAYVLDMGLLLSCLGLVLTIMSRTIDMDLIEVWTAYPNEITPLVLTLFCGFYLIYFSIFEKTTSSTLGKNLLGIMVVTNENKPQTFSKLLFRSFISLANFISLGLFSYFDLQNKVSGSKVIKAE